jgi:LCP family protein required for cell wall assembly
LGLLLGGFVLFAIALSLFSLFYWRQIEQNGPVNVLVLGIDERTTEQAPFRSDTMLLTSFNPNRREVALLNIPRDLWLNIPDYGENRINTAHFFGGPPLAKQAVAENFEIPLEYYVKLNFYGFVHIIDAMGGLTINVSERLYDENYPTADYGVTTIEIPAGEQQMNGDTALIYARSRYSTSDFDRSRRQQEIIAAVRDKLAQASTWFKLPAIYSAVTDSISTDIPTNQWPALGWLLVRSTIERWTIGAQDVYPFVTSGGAQVLAPNWERINPILACYFEVELSQEMCQVAKELRSEG